MGERRLLAIESSCDETAAAVVREDRVVLSNIVASQFDLHQDYGGVVPEIASRAHVRNILPVIRKALDVSQTTLQDLCAVAVTSEPGLVGSLLVGLTAAKTLAMSLRIPLLTVNHIEAHIYACGMQSTSPGSRSVLPDSRPVLPDSRPVLPGSRSVLPDNQEGSSGIYPCVGFVISGGHTNLYDCRSATDCRSIGGTTDDAAGEAFDKVARILGLAYPGGPSISKAAESGNPSAYQMPRPLLHSGRLDFSFSGLKTAVLYAARGVPGPSQLSETPPERVNDLAAAFQDAAVDVLVRKSVQAVRQLGYQRLCVGGGVAANALLRDRLKQMAARERIELRIAAPELCTDNAAMAAIAWEWFEAGRFSPLDSDVLPGLVRHSFR